MMDNYDSGLDKFHHDPDYRQQANYYGQQPQANTHSSYPMEEKQPIKESPAAKPLVSAVSDETLAIGDNEDDFIAGQHDYSVDAEYDPCREWLRLLAAFTSLVVGIIAVYPIHLGVDCYMDNFDNEVIDLTQCKNLFNIPYSLTVLGVAVLTEAICLFLFFFSCRHEFCGVKRRYKTGLMCCPSRPNSRVSPSPVPRAPKYD